MVNNNGSFQSFGTIRAYEYGTHGLEMEVQREYVMENGISVVLCIALSILSLSGWPSSDCGTIELVESHPVETSLDSPALRDTPDVWLELIRNAEDSLKIETFYFSEDPLNRDRMDQILDEIDSATIRGVKLRVLSDAGFDETYPSIRQRLDSMKHAETRILDARRFWGGVLHAKFFIVDDLDIFIGSQNWDWRSLEHIRELGVHIVDEEALRTLNSLFQYDWATAGGRKPPADTVYAGPFLLRTANGDTVSVNMAGSPENALPTGFPWDQPMIIELLDEAVNTIRLHLLTYDPVDEGNGLYGSFDTALRRAAARGVDIRIIVSDWSKRHSILPYIQSLAIIPGISVRFTSIPEWSGGFIPYARVEHPKYCVIDETACWIGTANWNPGSFRSSRNVGLVIKGEAIAEQVASFFEMSWNSPYADPVDPCGEYSPPRRAQ